MSIILKGNNISSNNNGIGPSEVTNIKASQNASSIILSWTNPSNVVIDGTTMSTFDHVIIVRNEDHYPTSIKDGNTIYSGNRTTCSDSDVIKNKKYYYRFFVYDTNKLCNNNINMIIENTLYGVDPILKNNTWSQIAAASEAGIASKVWNIGDEIDIQISAQTGDGYDVQDISAQTATLQIWDFNHFDKSDGSGKAGICFGMKNPMYSLQYMNYNMNTMNGGWNNTSMRKRVMPAILKSLPSDLQSYIKEVNTYATERDGSSTESDGLLCTDKVFIPGFTELFGSDYNVSQYITEKAQKKFPIFTDDNSRKKLDEYASSAYFWMRSPCYSGGNWIVWLVNTKGEAEWDRYASSVKHFVIFCFNV